VADEHSVLAVLGEKSRSELVVGSVEWAIDDTVVCVVDHSLVSSSVSFTWTSSTRFVQSM